MSNCKFETSNGRCGLKGCYAYRHKCFTEDLCKCHEPKTNADRIRAMSDEELAEWIYNGSYSDPCDYCENNNGYCDGTPCKGKANAEIIAEWLKQPLE